MSAYVDQHRERFGVEPICQVLGVPASAYYRRATGDRSARDLEDERLLEVIRETHKASYFAYGCRRMWKALRRAGERVPRCQVQRLMAEHGIRARSGVGSRGAPRRATRRRPSNLILSSVTSPRRRRTGCGSVISRICGAGRGLLFFAFILDVYSPMIVGWQLASQMRTDLVLDALRMALGTRGHGADLALVAHTDAGSQHELLNAMANRSWTATRPS